MYLPGGFMEEVSLELIILVIVVACIVFAGVGIFMSTRISGGKKRIRELEGELKDAKKDLEGYRSEVNDHFKKTSELFTTMTESYKAVYIHLAEGSQDLCTSDAALLKGADSDFLKVTHEESDESPEALVSGEEQRAKEQETISEQPEPSEKEPDATPGQEEVENPAEPESNGVDEGLKEPIGEESKPAEDSREKKDGLPADR
jgi:hypothetical protein